MVSGPGTLGIEMFGDVDSASMHEHSGALVSHSSFKTYNHGLRMQDINTILCQY